MSEGRERVEWARLSVLLTLIANCNRDPKKGRSFKPTDFDPFKSLDDGGNDDIVIDDLGLLKARFVGGTGK